MKKRELASGLALVGAVCALCLQVMTAASRRIEAKAAAKKPPTAEK